MKKLSILMLLALVFLLSCRTEIETESHASIHSQNKNSSKIKFHQFQSETKVKDFKAFVHVDSHSLSKGSTVLLAFKIDSTNINKLDFNDLQTYTFRAYNIFESPENIYNVLYYKGMTKWEFSLLKIIRNSQNKTEKIIPIYDSSVGEISVAENSVLGKNSCMTEIYFTEFHCTCPPSWGSCDLCSECVTESHTMVTTDCGGDGSGNPIFNTSPSGLPVVYPGNYFHDPSNPPSYISPPQNPSPYYFDPNIPPTIDKEYVKAVRSDNFWFQLDNNGKLWGQQHPDMYNALLENYLKNYTTSNNSNNLQFHNWGISFLNENPTITLEQFQKWFIDGYSDTYKTKLSLLSSTEIQELVNINKEIDASPYDEEFVKETNEAFVAFTAYGDIDTMTDSQMQTVLNQCCPSIIVVPQAMTIEKSRMIVATYRFNRKFYPEWSKTKCFWEASRETIQLLLDLGGLAPVIGEVCDLTNGVIYTIQGDGLNASLSYASAIPVAGWFAAGSKYGVKVINASDIASRQVLKWIVGNDGLIKFGYSSQLRKVLKLTDATKQAHHIIPWAYNIQIHSVVQKAAKSADAFHLNEALNGIAVASWRNQPNHNVYNNKIFSKLELFKNSNPNATPQECYNFLNDLIGDVRTWIINHPNSHLNDLVLP